MDGFDSACDALEQAVLSSSRVDVVACCAPALPPAGNALGDAPPTGLSTYDDGGERADRTRMLVDAAVATTVASVPGTDLLEVATTLVTSEPAVALLAAAEGADLLVLGSQGHGPLASLLRGSVVLHCTTHSPSPVLVVRDEQT